MNSCIAQDKQHMMMCFYKQCNFKKKNNKEIFYLIFLLLDNLIGLLSSDISLGSTTRLLTEVLQN